MIRTIGVIATIFCVFAASSAQASKPEAKKGFLVFSTQGVENYVFEQKKGLVFAGKSSGDADDYFSVNGKIYYLEKILGEASMLGDDMRPLLKEKIRNSKDVPYWLGAWDKGLLVLNDNVVVYLDYSLKQQAALPLEPRKIGEIVPALMPKYFMEWKGTGYLLANTGEIFTLPLEKPATSASKPRTRIEEGVEADKLWIDAEEGTLNVLGHSQSSEFKAGAGGEQVVKKDVVFTYSLDSLNSAPIKTVIYEKTENRTPVEGSFRDFTDSPDDGRIYERIPPYKTTSEAKGMRIGMLSRSVPSYADAYFEGGEIMPPRVLIILKSQGKHEAINLSEEKGEKWFKTKDGKKVYVDKDIQAKELRLQPEYFILLKSAPELKDKYIQAVAY